MPFQTTVRAEIAFGIPGELFSDGPVRAAPWTLQSKQPNLIGHAYTYAHEGVAQVGGTGPFVGILVHPKHYASYGTPAGTLAPTMALANDSVGELLTMGEIMVSLPFPTEVGYLVIYDTITGALSALAADSSVPAGSAKVPHAVVSRYSATAPAYQPTAAQLAVITLTH